MNAVPFSLQTHVYSGKGHEELLAYRPYKRFEKVIDDMLCVIQVQGGQWFAGGDGSTPLAREEVPDWVWNECRDMAPKYRLDYRISLPDEEAIPTVAEAEKWPPEKEILAALLKLDEADNKHWTRSGQPSLEALAMLGCRVSRRRLDDDFPRFLRTQVPNEQ